MKECMHVAWLISWHMLGYTICWVPLPPIAGVIVREVNELIWEGFKDTRSSEIPCPGERADSASQLTNHLARPRPAAAPPSLARLCLQSQILSLSPEPLVHVRCFWPLRCARSAGSMALMVGQQVWGKESPWSRTDLASKPHLSMTTNDFTSAALAPFSWL